MLWPETGGQGAAVNRRRKEVEPLPKNKDQFGINMIKYCKAHEAYMQKQFEGGADPAALLEYHNGKIGWLQHERLVHLLVTMLTAVLFLFLFVLELLMQGDIPVLALLAAVMVLLVFYLFHYFRLENAVQHWYVISDEIYLRISGK